MALHDFLVDAALLALIIVALGFVLAALLLIFSPGRFRESESGPGHWVLEPLETPRHIERFVYRHHRPFGLAVVAITAVSLWQLIGSGLLWPPVPAGGTTAWLWLLVAALVLTLVIGMVIALRPSGLKPVETRANRWIGWRNSSPQRWLWRHPRVRGILILLISSYALLVFGVLLLDRVSRWSATIH